MADDMDLRLRWASLQSRKRAVRYRSLTSRLRGRGWVTATDAAEIIGCSRKAMWNWEQRGKLDGKNARIDGTRQKVFRLEDVRTLARSSTLKGTNH